QHRVEALAELASSGTLKGMPALRILALARVSRCPIADGWTRNAEAIRSASSPMTVCSISGGHPPAAATSRERAARRRPFRVGAKGSPRFGDYGRWLAGGVMPLSRT